MHMNQVLWTNMKDENKACYMQETHISTLFDQ